MLKMVNGMKKRVKDKPLYWIGIWIALGAAIGIPIGNIPIGVGLGTCIGFFFFLTSFLRNKSKVS